MNRVAALDLSTKTGWAVLGRDESTIKLDDYGLITLREPISKRSESYPWNYLYGTRDLARDVVNQVLDHDVDTVAIEETNRGKQRYTQKILEFIHYAVLAALNTAPRDFRVVYVSSSAWRHHLAIELTKEDKRNNARLSRAKSKARKAGAALDKKALGIRGRVNKKHAAVRWANAEYGLQLIQKDNDIADAIAVGTAALTGVTFCTGTER